MVTPVWPQTGEPPSKPQSHSQAQSGDGLWDPDSLQVTVKNTTALSQENASEQNEMTKSH